MLRREGGREGEGKREGDNDVRTWNKWITRGRRGGTRERKGGKERKWRKEKGKPKLVLGN